MLTYLALAGFGNFEIIKKGCGPITGVVLTADGITQTHRNIHRHFLPGSMGFFHVSTINEEPRLHRRPRWPHDSD